MISGVPCNGLVRRLAFATPALVVLLFSGCDESYPTDLKYPPRTDVIVDSANLPEVQETYPDPPGSLGEHMRNFQEKGGKVFDPAKLDGKQRAEIAASLEKCFGIPAKPRVMIAENVQVNADDYGNFVAAVKDLQLDDATLEAGSTLYRRHCLQCHGVTGDGRGPTGPWLNPHPRDYRKGRFKFISTVAVGASPEPTREDLHRVLKNGIDYTAMPSFGLLSDRELDQLVSYVIHLSLRGVAEEETMRKLIAKEPLEAEAGGDELSVDHFLQFTLRNAVLRKGGWAEANKLMLTPSVSPPPAENETERWETVRKGYELFVSAKAQCLSCHTNFGRDANYRYDKWGTLVQPRNLTAGNLRGGRRPIDLFWRIRAGIDPSSMPKAALTDEEAWTVVAFVRALPYPNMLPEDVRRKVYPDPVVALKE